MTADRRGQFREWLFGLLEHTGRTADPATYIYAESHPELDSDEFNKFLVEGAVQARDQPAVGLLFLRVGHYLANGYELPEGSRQLLGVFGLELGHRLRRLDVLELSLPMLHFDDSDADAVARTVLAVLEQREVWRDTLGPRAEAIAALLLCKDVGSVEAAIAADPWLVSADARQLLSAAVLQRAELASGIKWLQGALDLLGSRPPDDMDAEAMVAPIVAAATAEIREMAGRGTGDAAALLEGVDAVHLPELPGWAIDALGSAIYAAVKTEGPTTEAALCWWLWRTASATDLAPSDRAFLAGQLALHVVGLQLPALSNRRRLLLEEASSSAADCWRASWRAQVATDLAVLVESAGNQHSVAESHWLRAASLFGEAGQTKDAIKARARSIFANPANLLSVEARRLAADRLANLPAGEGHADDVDGALALLVGAAVQQGASVPRNELTAAADRLARLIPALLAQTARRPGTSTAVAGYVLAYGHILRVLGDPVAVACKWAEQTLAQADLPSDARVDLLLLRAQECLDNLPARKEEMEAVLAQAQAALELADDARRASIVCVRARLHRGLHQPELAYDLACDALPSASGDPAAEGMLQHQALVAATEAGFRSGLLEPAGKHAGRLVELGGQDDALLMWTRAVAASPKPTVRAKPGLAAVLRSAPLGGRLAFWAELALARIEGRVGQIDFSASLAATDDLGELQTMLGAAIYVLGQEDEQVAKLRQQLEPMAVAEAKKGSQQAQSLIVDLAGARLTGHAPSRDDALRSIEMLAHARPLAEASADVWMYWQRNHLHAEILEMATRQGWGDADLATHARLLAECLEAWAVARRRDAPEQVREFYESLKGLLVHGLQWAAPVTNPSSRSLLAEWGHPVDVVDAPLKTLEEKAEASSALPQLAVEVLRELQAFEPKLAPGTRHRWLRAVGLAWRHHPDQSRSEVTLRRATLSLEASWKSWPTEDAEGRCACAIELADAQWQRASTDSDPSARLATAEATLRAAIDAMPPGLPAAVRTRAGFLLGVVLQYGREADLPKRLDEAERVLTAVLESPDRSMSFDASLYITRGNARRRHAELKADTCLVLLEGAISDYRHALALMADENESLELARAQKCLADALAMRGRADDLAEAVHLAEAALSLRSAHLGLAAETCLTLCNALRAQVLAGANQLVGTWEAAAARGLAFLPDNAVSPLAAALHQHLLRADRRLRLEGKQSGALARMPAATRAARLRVLIPWAPTPSAMVDADSGLEGIVVGEMLQGPLSDAWRQAFATTTVPASQLSTWIDAGDDDGARDFIIGHAYTSMTGGGTLDRSLLLTHGHRLFKGATTWQQQVLFGHALAVSCTGDPPSVPDAAWAMVEACLRDSLALLHRHVPQDSLVPDLQNLLARTLFHARGPDRRARWSEALDLYRDARSRARRLGDGPTLVSASINLAALLDSLADLGEVPRERAWQVGEETVALCDAAASEHHRILVRVNLGWSLVRSEHRKDIERALVLLDEAVTAAARVHLRRLEMQALNNRGVAWRTLAAFGDPTGVVRSAADYQRCAELAAAEQDDELQSSALHNLGDLWLSQGQQGRELGRKALLAAAKLRERNPARLWESLRSLVWVELRHPSALRWHLPERLDALAPRIRGQLGSGSVDELDVRTGAALLAAASGQADGLARMLAVVEELRVAVSRPVSVHARATWATRLARLSASTAEVVARNSGPWQMVAGLLTTAKSVQLRTEASASSQDWDAIWRVAASDDDAADATAREMAAAAWTGPELHFDERGIETSTGWVDVTASREGILVCAMARSVTQTLTGQYWLVGGIAADRWLRSVESGPVGWFDLSTMPGPPGTSAHAAVRDRAAAILADVANATADAWSWLAARGVQDVVIAVDAGLSSLPWGALPTGLTSPGTRLCQDFASVRIAPGLPTSKPSRPVGHGWSVTTVDAGERVRGFTSLSEQLAQAVQATQPAVAIHMHDAGGITPSALFDAMRGHDVAIVLAHGSVDGAPRILLGPTAAATAADVRAAAPLPIGTLMLAVCSAGRDHADTAEWGALAAAFLASGARRVIAAVADAPAENAVALACAIAPELAGDSRSVARALAAVQRGHLSDGGAPFSALVPADALLFQLFCLA
jgi:hypothetical protein